MRRIGLTGKWGGIVAVLLALLAVALLARGGAAQEGWQGAGDAAQAPAGALPQPYIRAAKERYRVFVFGDKMATGLLAGLWRILANDPRFIAKGRFRAGSGLVRLSHYDWQRAVSQVLENQPVDIAIVMLGANDVRDIFLRGQRIAFGSEEWKRIYASRVDALLEAFRNADVAVYLVGLPPMRDARFDAATRLINDILRQRAAANGVRFIDIRRHFAGPDGGFAENGPDIGGQVVRLRARNGIHFIRPGNTKLASIVMGIIRDDVKQAARLPAQGALGAGMSADKPFVGRAAPDGAPIYEAPASLPDDDAVYLARHSGKAAQAARDTLELLRRSAMPGSRAARLFTQGVWQPAPAGRIDDFSAPAEAYEKDDARQRR